MRYFKKESVKSFKSDTDLIESAIRAMEAYKLNFDEFDGLAGLLGWYQDEYVDPDLKEKRALDSFDKG